MQENRAETTFGKPNALADRIGSALPQLSKKQQRIARLVLDDQEYVAFASASEVGARTESSAATVVRLCQSLGYEGYIHLQLAVREGLSLQRTAAQRLKDRLADPIPHDDLPARVFATDIHNIERTIVLTENVQVRAAMAAVRQARRILVVGDGLGAGLALLLTHSLQAIGLPAVSVIGGGEPLALALAFTEPEDVVIGIGFWRNLRDIVQAIQGAQEIGAVTIGITDERLSPLARLPDYPFQVSSDGVAHSRSPAAMLTLINAFVATLSLEMPDRVVESLSRVDEAYRQAGLLTE